jgi:hypothetical protein
VPTWQPFQPIFGGGDVVQRAELARRLLAVSRIANGTVALVAPAVLARRIRPPLEEAAAQYPFRLFGVRAIVTGVGLVVAPGLERQAPEIPVLIHASDVVAVVLAARSSAVSPGFARAAGAMSTVNTLLAVVAWSAARHQRPASRSRV